MNLPSEMIDTGTRGRADAGTGGQGESSFSASPRHRVTASFAGIWSVAKKDLREMLNSPMAYVLYVIFLLVTGYFFAQPLFVVGQANMAPFMDLVPLILVFLVPAITMRSLAEEFKSGTFEILTTLPLKIHEIVLGKYLAGLLVVGLALVLTGIYPVILEFLGSPDWGAVIGAYIGNFFLVSALASIGLFASSLTRNQVIAYLVSWAVGFGLFLAGKVIVFFPYPFADLLNFIGFDSHVDNISRGVLDSRDVLYFISLAAFFLSLALMRLEKKFRSACAK
ncbi:MAG: ABC transporter permease subunit [Elusimicrobia bacterium]|nr:ABC transporter permease subunit [Elusimicrobiota bacterium]